MATHAQGPVADAIDPGRFRIYFASRDAHNRSAIASLEADAGDPSRVLYLHDRPVLSRGELGCFDDSGVLPSCLTTYGGVKYLYYAGVSSGTTTPYHVAIGLATSSDGKEFVRAYAGPVLERTAEEPHLCTAPWVLVENGVWRMWYCAGLGWEVVDGRPEPLYHIRYTESPDGVRWSRPGLVCIDLRRPREAGIGRPSVVLDGNRYRMWFSVRGNRDYRRPGETSYRIGYAESDDGLQWRRDDDLAGIAPSADGWDSEMIEYPSVYAREGNWYMFYNGNGFGRSGFGYAVARRSDAE